MSKKSKYRAFFDTIMGHHERMIDEKKIHLNNLTIQKILFHKPLRKLYDITDILQYIKNEADNYTLRLSEEEIAIVTHSMCSLYTVLTQYEEFYLAAIKNDIKLRNIEPVPIQNDIHQSIRQYLGDRPDVYGVSSMSFYLEDVRLSSYQQPNYHFDFDLKCDIYGSISVERIIYGKKKSDIVLFAIIYLEENSILLHPMDLLLKQYFLCQMNIHTLFISQKMDFKAEFEDFVNKISEKRQYISKNMIKISRRSGELYSSINDDLDSFYQAYQDTRKLYLKLSKESITDPEASVSLVKKKSKAEKLELEENIIQKVADIGYGVSKEEFKLFLKNMAMKKN